MPKVSIIIPCFNGQAHIKRCLDSILESSFSDFEILIADDGSDDESQEILSQYEKNEKIRIFYFKNNQGPARLRNFLGQKALGKYLLFLDVDTRIESEAIETILKRLEAEERLAGLQPALIGPEGKLETVGHFLSPFGLPYEIGTGQNPDNFKKEMPIFGARTAALAVRKTIFDRIGGFDEDYLIYGEDTDFCWRIWRAGGKIIYFPAARVRHFQKSSFGAKTSHRIFYEGAKNNTANILKNASSQILFWLLPLEILGWLAVSLKLICQKRLVETGWIFRGLFWNLKNIEKTLAKRKVVRAFSVPDNQAEKIIFGETRLIDIIIKGGRWFKNV